MVSALLPPRGRRTINTAMKALPLLLLSSLACARLLTAEPTASSRELSLPEILAGYVKAQGGSAYIDSIETLRMEGTIEQDGQQLSFVQVKKQPDLIRMTVTLNGMELIMGYNGETAWQTVRQRRQAVELTGPARENLIRNAAMFNQLYQPHNPHVVRAYAGSDEFEGRPVYLIDVTLENGSTERYTIDQETFLDYRLEYSEVVDGSEHQVEYRYQDIRRLDRLQLPFRVESYRDGELVSVITLESIRLDAGVYLPYFDPPGGIEGLDEPPSEADKRPPIAPTGSTITGTSMLADTN